MASLENATQPVDTTTMQLVTAPAMGVNPQLNTSADPEFSPLALAPIPPVLGTDTDAARQFYRSNVSQLRMSPLPSLAKISQGAQAQSQVIFTNSNQGTGGGSGSVGINLLVNNVQSPVQDTLNLTGPGVSYGPAKGQVQFAGQGNYQEIQQAGTPVPFEPILNFLAPITATDNPGNTSTDIAVPDMVGDSGSGGVDGLVPAPPSGSFAAGKFLTAGGTWAVPTGTAFYQTIQQAGSSKPQENKLNFLAPMTATDNAGNNSTDIAVSVMVGDTGSGGVAGLVPAPPAGSSASVEFLRADGVFAVPPGSGGIGIVTVDLTGQSADISATTLVTPSVAGYYRASAWIVATAADGGVINDTLPAVIITFTDGDSSTSLSPTLIQSNPATVAAGNFGAPSGTWAGTLYAKASTVIQYSTSGYVSVGSALRYALHLRLEGPF